MSRLENSTKPVIDRLLTHQPEQLSGADQAALAAWAVKCAMVFEALREGQVPFYEVTERAALHDTLRIPIRTAIYLAKCIELSAICVNASDHSDTPDNSLHGSRMYSTTMGFGHVALQVVTLKLPKAVPDSTPITLSVRPGPWEQVSLALRESGAPIQWPPLLGLSGEAGLEAFSNRWAVPAGS
jgi:hypothetical protein